MENMLDNKQFPLWIENGTYYTRSNMLLPDSVQGLGSIARPGSAFQKVSKSTFVQGINLSVLNSTEICQKKRAEAAHKPLRAP